jgi:hypothetical protein
VEHISLPVEREGGREKEGKGRREQERRKGKKETKKERGYILSLSFS